MEVDFNSNPKKFMIWYNKNLNSQYQIMKNEDGLKAEVILKEVYETMEKFDGEWKKFKENMDEELSKNDLILLEESIKIREIYNKIIYLYNEICSKENISKIEQKFGLLSEKLSKIEQLSSNYLTYLGIFISLFSLIMVNFNLFEPASKLKLWKMLIFMFSTNAVLMSVLLMLFKLIKESLSKSEKKEENPNKPKNLYPIFLLLVPVILGLEFMVVDDDKSELKKEIQELEKKYAKLSEIEVLLAKHKEIEILNTKLADGEKDLVDKVKSGEESLTSISGIKVKVKDIFEEVKEQQKEMDKLLKSNKGIK